MNVNKVAEAIEKDTGVKLPGLKESLKEMNAGINARTYTPEQLLLREARKALKLTQPKFAKLIDTPVGTLRDWEQGRFPLPGAVKRLSKIAISHPKIVLSS